MKKINFLIFLSLVLILFNSFAAAQSPKYGGTLIISNQSDITNLNPLWSYNYAGYGICTNIYSTLIVTDMGVTVGQEPYGNLAKNWEVSDNGLTYTFHLYDNVYWHDGVKFSSEDIRFTYETAMKKNFPIGNYLENVKEILTPDKNIIILKLSQPNSAFFTMLAQASNWYGQILPKHLYENTDIVKNPYNNKPVGTGPFIFEEWQPGQFVSLKANQRYFRGRPYLDRIVYRLYASKEVAQADFRSGNIDIMVYTQAPPAHELKNLAAAPHAKMWRQESIYSHDIMFNHNKKPCSDIRVRQAISLAINREQVCQLAWAGLVEPNYYASSLGTPTYTNGKVKWPKQDLKEAAKLLDSAGYPAGSDGIRMKMTAICSEYYKEMTEVIVQQLKNVGIQVNLSLVDNATWNSRLTSGDFDFSFYWFRFGPDPDAYREHFGTKRARNFGKYSNDTVNQLLDEGIKVFDFNKRKSIYDKVQEILLKDFAYLPVSGYKYFEFSKRNLHGTPMGDPSSYGKSCGWAGLQSIWFE